MNAERGIPIAERPGWYLSRVGRAQDDGVEYTEVEVTFYDAADAGETSVLRMSGAQPQAAILAAARDYIDSTAAARRVVAEKSVDNTTREA